MATTDTGTISVWYWEGGIDPAQGFSPANESGAKAPRRLEARPPSRIQQAIKQALELP